MGTIKTVITSSLNTQWGFKQSTIAHFSLLKSQKHSSVHGNLITFDNVTDIIGTEILETAFKLCKWQMYAILS